MENFSRSIIGSTPIDWNQSYIAFFIVLKKD